VVRRAPDKQLRRGVHRSTRELETAIARYIDVTNERPPIRVDQDRRPNPRERHSILSSHL